MLKRYLLKISVLIAFAVCWNLPLYAQTDPLEKNLWFNEEKTAKIQIYHQQDGRFYGKIVWLKEPLRDGKPKTDMNNPDKERRNDPELGLVILKGLKKDGTNSYEDGSIYDPKNGKTYSSKITIDGNVLHLRGYIGISLLGRTATWTKAD